MQAVAHIAYIVFDYRSNIELSGDNSRSDLIYGSDHRHNNIVGPIVCYIIGRRKVGTKIKIFYVLYVNKSGFV